MFMNKAGELNVNYANKQAYVGSSKRLTGMLT